MLEPGLGGLHLQARDRDLLGDGPGLEAPEVGLGLANLGLDLGQLRAFLQVRQAGDDLARFDHVTLGDRDLLDQTLDLGAHVGVMGR